MLPGQPLSLSLPGGEVEQKGSDLGVLALAQPLAGCGLGKRLLAGLSLAISKVGDFGLI